PARKTTPPRRPCLARRDGDANLPHSGRRDPSGPRTTPPVPGNFPETRERRPTRPAPSPRSAFPMPALICGSLAYDTIMVFPDQFKNHILPDKVHILNVSFLVPRMRREFGGCAGNIAYNLKLL